jgi:hypothetical protein
VLGGLRCFLNDCGQRAGHCWVEPALSLWKAFKRFYRWRVSRISRMARHLQRLPSLRSCGPSVWNTSARGAANMSGAARRFAVFFNSCLFFSRIVALISWERRFQMLPDATTMFPVGKSHSREKICCEKSSSCWLFWLSCCPSVLFKRQRARRRRRTSLSKPTRLPQHLCRYGCARVLLGVHFVQACMTAA